MSTILVAVLISILAIVLWGIWFAVKELGEFEKAFHYGIMTMLLLIVGAAVYLSFATPSLATPDNKQTPGKVIEQESNLLAE